MSGKVSFSSAIGGDQFLKLLVAELRHQDPTDPLKDREFISQLTELSTLEAIEGLKANFADMLAFQRLTQGSQLIGRTVSYDVQGQPTAEGVVSSLKQNKGRLLLVMTDSTEVEIDKVKTVKAA